MFYEVIEEAEKGITEDEVAILLKSKLKKGLETKNRKHQTKEI